MQNVGNESGKSKTSAPWFKCFPKDWRKATRFLTAEQRGIYFDCLCIMYEEDIHLPADDKWMAHQLHVSVRAWRSALSTLAKNGKLLPLQDGWTNSRADEERLKRRSTADQNAIIAQSREDQKREKAKKGNENNKAPPPSVPRNDHHAGRASQSLESRDSEAEKKKPIPASVELDAADPLASLNGSAGLMLSDIVGWMHNGDERSARAWLATQLSSYGESATREGWSKLKTEMAEGAIFAHPLRAWCGIAARKKGDAEKAPSNKKSALQIIAEMEVAGEF